MKKLIPAFALLLVSAVLMSTASFAWFSMNSTVSATNMEVRAVAEQGLLINEVSTADDTHWDNEATANQTASNPVLLYPASTANGSAWYHASSKKSYSPAAASSGSASTDLNGGYETLTGLVAITSMSTTASAGTNAFREAMGKTATDAAGYYVHYTYYIKSSGDAITGLAKSGTGKKNVRITSVTATADGSDSADLNKSLRVGIKLATEFYIYAPIADFTATYYVNASSTATTPIAGSTPTLTDLTALPSVTTDGTPVEVYIWYEGEDANCKTDNALAVELDNIDVDIVFELVDAPAA